MWTFSQCPNRFHALKTSSVQEKHAQLQTLLSQLTHVVDPVEKLEILDALPEVANFAPLRTGSLATFLAGVNVECAVALKSVVAIGQGDTVLSIPADLDDPFEGLRSLLHTLLQVEHFYAPMGGIVGYHCAVLELLTEMEQGRPTIDPDVEFLQPEGIDISQDTPQVRRYLRRGIEDLSQLADIYPVGGAGDRLDLRCNDTGTPLPAALLQFRGFTLLERLFRDLSAREYLHYKITGNQITTPVALMTSEEKDNRIYIQGLCQQYRWFGRPVDSIRLFDQPMVPVILNDGNWAVQDPLSLVLKPGGHGVMWKLAQDHGILDWFQSRGRHKALVRQINNPVSATDHGLLTFCGVGLAEDKRFGFASCPREVHATEGMNVLVQRPSSQGFRYHLSNIEYTEFALRGIQDVPAEKGSPYSAFPANTNVLFVDIRAIQGLCHEHPVPGKLINMKSKVAALGPRGRRILKKGGRLESMMQNIADYIYTQVSEPLAAGQRDQLDTYLTFNERRKTISVTKNLVGKEGSIHETPRGCHYDILANSRNCLTAHCGMTLPEMPSEAEYVAKGPAFLVAFNPSLGPLWSVVGQKISGGRLAYGSELVLELAELSMKQVSVDGSLVIYADSPIGHTTDDGLLHYSEACGKCVLENVQVTNKGIDRDKNDQYWQGEPVRAETCQILLKGSGEFVAKNVQLRGNHEIVVPDGRRVTAYMEGEQVKFSSERISTPKPLWNYAFDEADRVKLTRNW